MQKGKKIKYLLSACLILGALIYLLFTTFTSSLQYYVTVSELYAKEEVYRHRILKVAGRAENIKQIAGDQGPTFQFDVLEGGKSLHVTYTGFVPDTFKDGADVVVTGSYKQEGQFDASEILAKCASKYETKIDSAQEGVY